MTRKVVACVLALALGLCAWVPSVAIAEANVEHDTQTEVLDMVVQGDSDTSDGSGGSGSASGTQTTTTTTTSSAPSSKVSSASGSGTKTPQTADGTSAIVPVALAGAALATLCVGKAVRE